MIKKWRTCRVCGAKTRLIKSFGSMYMNAFVATPREKTPRVPLKLMLCDRCGLMQLKHTAPFEVQYREMYWYKSGINPVIVDDLKDIVRAGLRESKKKKGVWIDVGSNDGTLLQQLKVPAWHRIGVEPAKNLEKELRQNCDEIHVDYWENVRTKKADVISAIGMLYDSEFPNTFILNVKAHLKPGGIFIAQLMTLEPMLQNADLGNIVHEHLLFLPYKTLVRLFEKNGLEIYKVEKNGINGGSYRLFARHYKNGSVELWEQEPNYAKFFRKIEENKKALVKFVKTHVKHGCKVYLYGASTKASSITQYYGLDHKWITGAADRNPAKWGKFMVGTNIPIMSEEMARDNADVFWVMPYGFIDHFLEREKEWRSRGQMVVSMPEFRVY